MTWARHRGATVALVAASCIGPATGHVSAESDDAFPVSVSEVAWTAELPFAPSMVVPVGDTVVAMVGETLVALDAATGDVVWQTTSPSLNPIDVLAAPASDVALVVSEADDDHWTVTGLDAASGEQRYAWEAPALGGQPDEVIAVTAEHALMSDVFGTLRARSVATGDEAWTAELPDSCPRFVSPSSLATASGFVVACGTVDPVAREVVSGGYISFDDRTGTVAWTDVRDGMQAPPEIRPTASPDGDLVRLAFAETGQALIADWTPSIVDAATGEVLVEGDLAGELGVGGWFVHGEPPFYDGEYENLRTGERVAVEPLCGCGYPMSFLADGVVWFRPPRDGHAATVQFLTFGGGSSDEIEIDARLEWGYAAVGAGVVVLTNPTSPVVVALR